MSRSDLLTYGTTFVGVAIGFLFGGPICGFVLLVIGIVFLVVAHLKKDTTDASPTLNLNPPSLEPSINEQLRLEELKQRQRARVDREIALEERRSKHAAYVDGLAEDLQGFISKMKAADALGQINMAWIGYGQWLNQKGLMNLGANLGRYTPAQMRFERFELRDPKVLTSGRQVLLDVMEATELPPREVSERQLMA